MIPVGTRRCFGRRLRRSCHAVWNLSGIGWGVILLTGVFAATLPLHAAPPGYPASLDERPDRIRFEHGEFGKLEALAREHGGVHAIVELDVSYAPEGTLTGQAVHRQRSTVRSRQQDVLSTLRRTPFTLKHRYRLSPLLAVSLSPSAVEALEGHPLVKRIHLDTLSRPTLSESVPHIQADGLHANGQEGQGGMVVVLDTGMDTNHPAYGGRLVAQACFARGEDDDPTAGDCPNGQKQQVGPGAGRPLALGDSTVDGHGSHVGGIAAGRATTATAPPLAEGVAPGASIGSIMVFSEFTSSPPCPTPNPCALSMMSDQIKALEHVADTVSINHNVVAVNMSLGGESYRNPCDDDPRQLIISTLRSRGIVTVAAAGNESETAAINAPACIPDAVGVGATQIDDGRGRSMTERISPFSNQDTNTLDLVAPGVFIRSAAPNGRAVTRHGTSMAAPHVAGAWVVLHQATGAGVDEIERSLITTGETVTDDRSGAPTDADYVSVRLEAAFAALSEDEGSAAGGGGGGGGCVIERLVPDAGISSFRRLRDTLLLRTSAGRGLVHIYYRWLGPTGQSS